MIASATTVDDVLLEIVILLGTVAACEQRAAEFIASEKLVEPLVLLLSAKQEDDEIVLQIVYVFYQMMFYEPCRQYLVTNTREFMVECFICTAICRSTRIPHRSHARQEHSHSSHVRQHAGGDRRGGRGVGETHRRGAVPLAQCAVAGHYWRARRHCERPSLLTSKQFCRRTPASTLCPTRTTTRMDFMSSKSTTCSRAAMRRMRPTVTPIRSNDLHALYPKFNFQEVTQFLLRLCSRACSTMNLVCLSRLTINCLVVSANSLFMLTL